jgi:hypothetical protein
VAPTEVGALDKSLIAYWVTPALRVVTESVGSGGIDLLAFERSHFSELCVKLWLQSAVPDVGHIRSHLVTYNLLIKLTVALKFSAILSICCFADFH